MIDYDAHEWRGHLLDLKGSMVRQIFYRVMSSVAWSAIVVCVHNFIYPKLVISALGHTLIGTALGLLLVFRTNASYDRFWEGRRLWGAIVNDSRNLGRGVSVLMAGNPELAAETLRWLTAFPNAAMHQLRGTTGLGAISVELPADEVREVLASNHPPLLVARAITACLATARDRGLISDIVLTSLDANVRALMDSMGGCERIHKTPLPFAYVVHLRRALIAYCFTLPFAMLEPFGWGTIPAVLLIAYTLLGIEEIGVQIEDPFGADDNDLPLEEICARIESDLRMLLRQFNGQQPKPAAELDDARNLSSSMPGIPS